MPAAILVAGLVLMLLNPGGWRAETLAVSLQITSATLPTANSSAVTFVNIDEASLEAAGDWPWPRTQIARLVQSVAAQDAGTILLALPLSGPDAAAPQRAVTAWEATGASREAQLALSRLPDTNAVLLDVLRDTGAILALYPADTTSEEAVRSVTPLAEVAFERDGGNAFAPEINAAAPDPIASAAQRRAPLGLHLDPLGRPNGAYLIGAIGERVVPGAALLPLLSNGNSVISVQSNGTPGAIAFVDPVGIESLTIGEKVVPLMTDGLVLFRRDLTIPTHSAAEIMSGNASSFISNRIVVIGSTVTRVNEGDTALAPGLSAAQAIALAAAQVAAGTSPTRPFVYLWVELLAALILGAAIISLGQARRPWFGFGAALIGGAASYGASLYLLTAQGVLFDAAAVGLLLILVGAVGLLTVEGGIESHGRRLGHAIEGKLPFGAPAKLSRNPKRLLDHADSRKMTALCCSIRGFEELQDLYKDDPDGLTAIIQQFQELVGDQVRRLGGTVDRYGGATILAFWNAPVDEPDHALKACDCALRLVDGLERLNQNIEGQAYRLGKGFSPIHLGIGINTGRAVVGNVGSRKRPTYSAIGETVTVAQNLLATSAAYGPAIIVGEHTYQAVKNRFALLEIDKIAVPHRTYAVRVFALLGNPVTKASPRFRALEDAHEAIFEAYREQNWSLAEALIGECRKLNGAIPSLYDLYARRIAFYRQFPPGPEWDGAFSIPVV